MWIISYQMDGGRSEEVVILVPLDKADTPGEALRLAEDYADKHHGSGIRRLVYIRPTTVRLTHHVVK